MGSILWDLRPRGEELDVRGFEWYYLFDQCRRRGLPIHFDRYSPQVAFSRDSRWLVASVIRTGITLSDTWTGETWEDFRPEGVDAFELVAISPDGRLIALTAQTNPIILWDIRTRRE